MSEQAPAVPALFAGLFDDAAIFPPGNAAMADAVSGYRGHRSEWYAGGVGRFVCSGPRLDELAATPGVGEIGGRLALTVPDGVAALAHDVGVAWRHDARWPSAVEAPLRDFRPDHAVRALGAFGELGAGVGNRIECYLEIAPAALDAHLAREVVAADMRLKLRTGGTTAAAFPTEDELATAITVAAAAGLAFKCTAGLHNAVRHRDAATGFEHHGFLNVILATHGALTTDSTQAVAAALAEPDVATVARRVRALTPTDVSGVRALFRSFGTCSIRDPVDDLLAVGLLEAPR